MWKVIDLFAGVGGFSYGFLNKGFEVVLANEIDKYIANAYIQNHPGALMINEDITRLDITTVFGKYEGKIDVIIGGPPCQGFSQKGSRLGINDERNFLFKYYYKVVEYLKPKYFLIENVPNLFTTDKGYFKNEIFKLFGDIGYSLDAKVINAYDFGVPQIRNRAFILGRLGPKILSLPLGSSERVNVQEAIGDLAYLESGEGEEMQQYKYPASSSYQKKMREDAVLLYNHVATNHSSVSLERLKMIPIGGGKEFLPKEHLTKSIFSGTWTRMLKDEPSVTITTRFDTPASGRFTHPWLNRAITVREAARLQSFPDTFIFSGPKTSQMKQVGNAVPPKVAQVIAKVIQEDTEKQCF